MTGNVPAPSNRNACAAGHAGATGTRLVLLDGLRGVAAIAVMLYHVGNVFQFPWVFFRSYLFVDIFFILSGFVLTLTAEPKMRSSGTSRQFLRARIKRLWPTIAVGALLGALVTGLVDGWRDVPLLLAMALLMLPTFAHSWQVFPLNGPQWSLFHEVVANVVHGLVLRRLSQRALLAIVVLSGVALACTIARFGGNDLGPMASSFGWSFPRIAFAYTLGVLFGRRWQQARPEPLASWHFCLFMPLLAVMLLSHVPIDKALGDGLMTLIIFPALFWLAAGAVPPEGAQRGLERLGAISFPLYAVHLPILTLFGQLGRSWPIVISAIATTLLAAQLFVLAADAANARMSSRRRPGNSVPAT